VIQLTDPSTYEGGNLIICPPVEQPDANELRTQGTTIFFPSFLEHEATPVTKGTRYSLACWFDGPKWR
jgi:PKHD-type hydroxylase